MDIDEAAKQSGLHRDWVAEAVALRLIRAQSEGALLDVPEAEVTFLRRSRRWLPHLLDAVVSEDINSAVLFGRAASLTETRGRDSMVLTTIEDPGRALDLNSALSRAARRDIYVVTWTSGTQHPALLRDAVVTGRVLRDAEHQWEHFVETELPRGDLPRRWSPAEREEQTALLREWASTNVND